MRFLVKFKYCKMEKNIISDWLKKNGDPITRKAIEEKLENIMKHLKNTNDMKKIFEITHNDGEKEWCTGDTNISALANYITTTDCDISDMEGAEITELPKSKWGKYHIQEEDGETQTFKDWMEKNDNHDYLICGTMYTV